MTRSPHDRLLYAALASIFIGGVAFQTVISAEVLHHIWADSRHFNPAMLRSWDLELIAHVLTPFLCLLLGFYVAGVRIRDGRAWLLLAILTSFSVMVDGANSQEEAMQWATPFNHLALVYRSLGLYTFPFWLALFAIYFPEQAEWELRKPALKWIVLIPLGGLSGCMVVFRVLANERSTPVLAAMRDTASRYWLWAFYLSLVFFLAALPLRKPAAMVVHSRLGFPFVISAHDCLCNRRRTRSRCGSRHSQTCSPAICLPSLPMASVKR